MNKLSAVVLTKNEEGHVADCLDSLKWCPEVVVLDSYSSDRTAEIARLFGARVVLRPFQNFADQRNAAIDLVSSEWIFFVDADERVSPQLAAEISAAVQNQNYAGYWIPRHNYQLGRLILHAGLYPDYVLRLFRIGAGRYDPAQKVHEQVLLDGAAGYLVSEKLDGVRARWDGQRLLTRSGHAIDVPRWFTAGWPRQPMDGGMPTPGQR